MSDDSSSITEFTGTLATQAFSERDLAHGVTNWMISNFGAALADAVKSTPFTVPLLCAIACREAGAYWLPLTPHRSASEVLGLCVYDASGDVAGTSRSAFPTNTAQFRLAYGQQFTDMLVAEANKARAARGLSPAAIVYKGYGIFQYDLQFVRSDEIFFKSKQWYSFAECVARAVRELKSKFERVGDIQQAVRGYNGSGPRAEQYARDVMRLLPFCEEAANRPAAVTAEAVGLQAGFAVSTGQVLPSDDDPAAPQADEISETADFDTARVLSNLGAYGGGDLSPLAVPQAGAAGHALLSLDLGRAKAFLDACRTSSPRVTYGLGKKVPFLGAVPGRDFTRVDCSGFVREAVRLATSPSVPFPDGSVVQHDWVRARGFEKSNVPAGLQNDGMVRIAFLRPQDVPSRIGHVVLIAGGRTLESHGGVGPDSRPWDGKGWQAKTFVYVLAREAQFASVAGPAMPVAAVAAAAAAGTLYTVHRGRRYRATVTLGFPGLLADNATVESFVAHYGFTNVHATGSGSVRQVVALWPGPDMTAPLDPRLSNVTELPAVAPAAAFAAVSDSASTASSPNIAAPQILRSGKGVAMSNVFSTESIPTHHEGLLLVKMRPNSAPAVAAATAMSASATTVGLSALSFYERAGMIKRVVPLHQHDERSVQGPGVSALSALAAATGSAPEGQVSGGVSFIEMTSGTDTRQLQTALADDPNVETVSEVPVRYLAARSARKAHDIPASSDATIAAVPPNVPTMWNLAKILWEQARARESFHDADEVHIAVLDTGVDLSHPELQLGQPIDYQWEQPDLSRPVSDKDIIGHGTHVSGTIAAIANGNVGVKGICRCRLSVWKIFDDQPTYADGTGAFLYFVNPIMYRRALAACVESQVDVINLSIGGRGVPDSVERSLFDQLIAAGVTICAAMGNERQYGSPTSYPAAIPGVIAVGATALDDSVTLFSNSGNHIALSAPGKAIWSTLPTYPGQSGFSAVVGPDGKPTQGKPMRRETDYDAWDGTSMATPHVTACAALLLAKAHEDGVGKMTPDEVRKALMRSADKVPGMNGSAFSVDYGAGRLNLLRLLQ
jgi:subtilisin family serine protease